ncbi:DUF551 domain-containing protein [Burkholderia cepacia]|uniref:DUF551 domain-containing protein n=1 Tax=Burkholderia cepacia complex TaxID=87882 RepID=UPI00158BA549|nr:DUF551 domain-containing protein [Burkholderia cenocepacia]EKS9840634.1 DUF551 domain-containing protein [Burkholderia cepacia]
MDEREMFGAALADLSRMEEDAFDKPFPDDDLNALWAIWQAARRTTPDREAWISVDEKLPTCNRKAGSLGVEVLIYPAMETGERTAFFGRRISRKPMFYRYGAPVHGVTHWMPLPAEPPRAQKPSSR